MKKIYYFIALVAITAFSACNPLDKTYKDLGSLPAPATIYPVTSTTITLSAADYALLPKSNTATKTLSFKTLDSAKAGIPFILAAKYPTAGDKSSALVTYGITNPTFKPADSTYSHVYYAVINPDDYVAAQGTTNTTFKDYSDAQVLLFLKFKYPTPVDNQLVVLNYTYYASGLTPSSGVNATDSFIYLNGVWMKIYTVSNAQYASAGHGNYNQFVTADAPSTIVGYINTFLKTDPTVAATAKVGDLKYVSYNYYISSGTSKGTYQRVQVLTFDGSNWVTIPTASTALTFLKTNGTWVADNTVNYKLTSTDYSSIKTMTVNVQTARDNVAQFGDFNISTPLSATTGWSDADINSVIALILAHDYPNAVANQKFIITYLAYNGSTISVTKTFVFNGTTFSVSQ